MNNLKHKVISKRRRQMRVRHIIHGTAERPRLSVNVSLHNITAQLIDDEAKKTIAYSTTVGQKNLPTNLTERAKWVGQDIAKKAAAKKCSKVVFDRGSKLYHGRVAALADAARESGLEI